MPTLRFWPRVASLGYGHLHQLPNARLVEGGEGVLFEDAELEIRGQEVVDVVARDAEGGLREIVGAEREELGLFGDLIGSQSGARQLDHGAHHVVDLGLLLREDLVGDAANDGGLVAHLLDGPDERNHDLGMRIAALQLDRDRGLDDGARLHLGNLRERDAEAASTQPEHGVLLVQLFNARQQRAQFLELGRARLGVYEVLNFDQQIFALGQELVQRRIDQADGDGQRLPWP